MSLDPPPLQWNSFDSLIPACCHNEAIQTFDSPAKSVHVNSQMVWSHFLNKGARLYDK